MEFLKSRQSGRRFQDFYDLRQQESGGRFDVHKILHIGAGIVVVVIGLVLVPAPGPGWVIVFTGLGLFAGESLMIARFLDWFEPKVRKVAEPVHDFWNGLPVAVKTVCSLIGLVCGAAAMFAGYHFFYGREN